MAKTRKQKYSLKRELTINWIGELVMMMMIKRSKKLNQKSNNDKSRTNSKSKQNDTKRKINLIFVNASSLSLSISRYIFLFMFRGWFLNYNSFIIKVKKNFYNFVFVKYVLTKRRRFKLDDFCCCGRLCEGKQREREKEKQKTKRKQTK